jgi:hypothetical protein
MPKISREGGATVAGGSAPEGYLTLPDQNLILDGDLQVNGNFTVGGTSSTGPAPAVEGDYVSRQTNFGPATIAALTLVTVTGWQVEVPDLDTVVYVYAECIVSHSVANAEVALVLCKTVPAPATILDAIGTKYVCLNATAGRKSTAAARARLAPNTPCTVQAYLAGTAGDATITAASYAEAPIWYETK